MPGGGGGDDESDDDADAAGRSESRNEMDNDDDGAPLDSDVGSVTDLSSKTLVRGMLACVGPGTFPPERKLRISAVLRRWGSRNPVDWRRSRVWVPLDAHVQRTLRRLTEAYTPAFVCGVYAAALQQLPIAQTDLQEAVDVCREAPAQIDLTHFLVTLEAQQRQGHGVPDRRLIEARFAAILSERCVAPHKKTTAGGQDGDGCASTLLFLT